MTTENETHIPRGERADFLKITLTIPADLLTELRALGMRRKANKRKDTDTSALIREALVDFLNKNEEGSSSEEHIYDYGDQFKEDVNHQLYHIVKCIEKTNEHLEQVMKKLHQ